LLRFRAAAKCSRSIGEFDELPHDEQVKWLALCLLDGDGEEWMHITQAIKNGLLDVCRTGGAHIDNSAYVSLEEVERYRQFNPAVVPHEMSRDAFAAHEATLRNMILGGR